MNAIKGKNKVIIPVVLVALASIFFISWKMGERKSLSPIEYVKWVQDDKNGLNIKKGMGNVSFSIQYQPAGYLVANEEKDPHLRTLVFNKKMEKYIDLEYYAVRIESKENKDVLTVNLDKQEDYYARENYYSFEFQNDIIMIEGKDTLGCAMFNFIPSYGLSPHIDFVVAFVKSKEEKEKAAHDRQLVIDDRIMGDGLLKFEIKKDDINNIPSIITY
jgi:hypothetical protein